MRPVYDVSQVRLAEATLMADLPAATLMERAATGLADACTTLMRDGGWRVAGARVVLLVGTGNNGGDALFAGAQLADRGARVDAVLLGGECHGSGLDALRRSGGSVVPAGAVDDALTHADLVIDGILGIGGRGGLRPEAARCAALARRSGALIVAVDIPSGVDADTGMVADPAAVIDADATVTFGSLKPGLLLAPGRDHAGAVLLVDIGLDDVLPGPSLQALDAPDIAESVPEPQSQDYKYTRGVVGIAAGSRRYRGAAFMATGAARLGNVGMVQVLDRGDGIASALVDEFWDVVISTAAPASVARTTGWVVGPGIGTDADARSVLVDVLAADAPVVVDADALHLLSEPGPAGALAARARPTVVTPHAGEFAAMGFTAQDRLGAARAAARDLGVIVVLKGPGTVIAAPSGAAYIDTWGTPDLGTAGSGDVLSGLLGSLLAGAQARSDLDDESAALVAAAGVGLHGLAGRLAGEGGRPVTAPDIMAAIPRAMAAVRRGTGA
jgi:hydroxyethylthiazole kinase-like uncharacterized protein yjeF